MAAQEVPVLPLEMITEILLKLPPKPLSKFKCVSRLWLKLISSPQFTKTHSKLSTTDKNCSHHRLMFLDPIYKKPKVCCLPSLLCTEPSEVFYVDCPLEELPPVYFSGGSANGLIYQFNSREHTFIWNPATRKSRKINFPFEFGWKMHSGFGYDESHDDYKAVSIEYIRYDNATTVDTMVKIYSLRTGTWRTVDGFQGGFVKNLSGRFVNGKLYWASSPKNNLNVEHIVSLDITDETWGILEIPSSIRIHHPLILGVVGSNLSVLSTCDPWNYHEPLNCYLGSPDVWIMKDGDRVTLTKMFTIKYPPGGLKHLEIMPLFSFSIHFSESKESEILLLLPGIIMIYNPKDGSTRQVEKDIEFEDATEIYVESLIDPLHY